MFENAQNHRLKEPYKTWLVGRNKIVTGFCSTSGIPEKSQGHEGAKPQSYNGHPMKTCEFHDTCPCTCHYQIDQMYSMIPDMDRPIPEQSAAYLEHLRDQLHEFDHTGLPMDPFTGALSIPGGTGAHPTDEDALAGTQDAPHGTIQPVFTPTASGRRARGQLEYDVLTVCDEYSRDVYEWEYCTAKNVSERIGVMNQTEPPSTGAVSAVWDRWEKLGFAKRDKKPDRFVAFQIDGSLNTLAMLKDRVKRTKKRTRAEIKRGVLR